MHVIQANAAFRAVGHQLTVHNSQLKDGLLRFLWSFEDVSDSVPELVPKIS